MKNKNILALLENHVDKIVLAVCVLVGLFLLWSYVIGNPYGEKVRVKKLSPSQIDIYVLQQAEAALPQILGPAPIMSSVPDYLSKYNQLVQSPLSEISSSVRIPSPGVGEMVLEEKRLYALPSIPSLSEAMVGRLRGAAKIPTEEIGPDRPYASSMNEIGDIDLVTVSARFGVQSLYNNFQQSFMGPRLKTSEKDPRLAAPVFARLELQRRTQQNHDEWGQWEVVSRTAIDPQRKLLEELPMVLDESSFGVDIWMSQYADQDVQHDILQPEAYLYTVSRLKWMSPEFLDEALDLMKRQEQQAARERQEELRLRRSTNSTDRRRTPTRPTTTRGRRGNEMTGRENIGGLSRTAAREERDADDVRTDFENALLNENSDIQSMRDPLLVWAHDDTAEPGKTYQYRIRIGVFNPITGKDWFQKDQADYKNQLVLWSDYSEPTTEVSVPKRIYVFPMNVIADKDASNGTVGVQVEVAKYYLGQWRDFDFDVYPGEVIGYEVEDVQEEDNQNVVDGYQPMMAELGLGQNSDLVDFTSDMTLVDVAKEIVWGSSLRPGMLNKMLYYDTENKIQQVAIGKSNWHSDTRGIYDDIQKSMTQGVERTGPGMPGGPMDEMMMEEMMMEEMMMMQ